ncbi:DUF2703 domain-containing protein [Desulfoprunum benzoelyticum]|uniref:DUF2703 domain-containing protein n=1 Tax=Desulfoprunum benzoelyticum TaxID=1506996 RepID=UPI00161691E3|nr:DUF2703 domain-containing protein [Desulfoprunum benzoelyticum]
MRILTIRWQRLVDEKGRTCPRCQSTGDTVSNTFQKIEKALAELGIAVDLKTEAIDFPMQVSWRQRPCSVLDPPLPCPL